MKILAIHNFHRKDILKDYITKIRNNTDIFKQFYISTQNDKMVERKKWDKYFKEKKEKNKKSIVLKIRKHLKIK